MVFANESEGGDFEGKLKFTLEQKGLVSQFSRWLVDRLVKREMRILMVSGRNVAFCCRKEKRIENDR